jgi:hypothetical protein
VLEPRAPETLLKLAKCCREQEENERGLGLLFCQLKGHQGAIYDLRVSQTVEMLKCKVGRYIPTQGSQNHRDSESLRVLLRYWFGNFRVIDTGGRSWAETSTFFNLPPTFSEYLRFKASLKVEFNINGSLLRVCVTFDRVEITPRGGVAALEAIYGGMTIL